MTLSKAAAEALAAQNIQMRKLQDNSSLSLRTWQIEPEKTQEYLHVWIVFYDILDQPPDEPILGGLSALLIDKETGALEYIAHGLTIPLRVAVYQALHYPATYNDRYPTLECTWREDRYHLRLNLVSTQTICGWTDVQSGFPYRRFDPFIDETCCLSCRGDLRYVGRFCFACGHLMTADDHIYCQQCVAQGYIAPERSSP